MNLSTDQLTKMAGRALQPFLVPLQKLQACACGNSEKYAQQILQMFEAEVGSVEDLKDTCSGTFRVSILQWGDVALGSSVNSLRKKMMNPQISIHTGTVIQSDLIELAKCFNSPV